MKGYNLHLYYMPYCYRTDLGGVNDILLLNPAPLVLQGAPPTY